MSSLLPDVRTAVRSLTRRPGSTLIALIALALGIGANTTIFSFVDRLLLRPLSLPEAERLVSVWTTGSKRKLGSLPGRSPLSPADYRDLRAGTSALEELAAYHWWNPQLGPADATVRLRGYRVTANFFRTLGIQPALGTGFGPDHEPPGRDAVVVVSHAMWEQRLASDPEVIGRSLELEGRTFTVLGVMPRTFDYPLGADLWAPLALELEPWATRDNYYLETVGRLRTGVSPTRASAEIQGLAQQLAVAYPGTNQGKSMRVVSLTERIILESGSTAPMLLASGATLFLLLLVCANVANYQLARGLQRTHEFAIRTALGASRARLVRQLLVESVLLALAAGALGWGTACWGVHLVKLAAPAHFIRFVPGWADTGVDWRGLLFSFALSAGAGILSGLLPALAVSRSRVSAVLNAGAANSTGGRQRHRLRHALVTAEVALALVLLTGTGLMVRAWDRITRFDTGMAIDHVVAVRVSVPQEQPPSPAALAAFEQAMLAALALPGTEATACAARMPVEVGALQAVDVEGQPVDPERPPLIVSVRAVSPGYFELLKLPLLSGRAPNRADLPGTLPVALVSESLARRLFATNNPLGQRLRLPTAEGSGDWRSIVGVAADVRHGPFTSPQPTLYVPLAQNPSRALTFLVRASGESSRVAAATRLAAREVLPELAPTDVMTLRDRIRDDLGGLRVMAGLLGATAVVALALSMLGVFSLMAQVVAQQTREIGVRLALGATPASVLQLILRRGFRLTALALALGVPVALTLNWALSARIMPELGLPRFELTTVAVVTLILAGTTLVASWLPACQASRLHPMAALRHD